MSDVRRREIALEVRMNKRLAKRHKRQVTRARERVRTSEPDVRTAEQIKAARDASRPPDPSSPFSAGHAPAASRGKAS